MHARKTIITCAVTGNITRPDQHPGLPITPAQIANASLEAAQAGAAAVHIHVRDPSTGRPSMDVALYREVIERIRAVDPELIINLTTGPGGRFIPSDDDPKVAAPGTTLLPPEKRVEHILALKPDICSLDLNTMNSGAEVVINTPKNVTRMANVIREAGVKPELEIFDTGDIHLARDLIASGVLDGPGLWTLVTGVKYGFSASPETLLYARDLLPAGAVWSAFGIGRFEFPIVAQSWLAGGHVRVGLEDNIYIDKGVLAESNAALVARAREIVTLLGGEIATSRDARELLGLAR
ncbi:3-keto-5-aminohexanoate cleavage protein [Burkholderia guangdongensis]|uniref:3-keto-5-aminohexanoate cleavage protein n=1 Tax=Burkholderia guangdongensis TaxID=1792500 RepID=UPI0015CA903D|nr:3-keto-5-aminohexanoate cleavage protein [Burkholderia guangdongensis]